MGKRVLFYDIKPLKYERILVLYRISDYNHLYPDSALRHNELKTNGLYRQITSCKTMYFKS